jgi:hypothetical protein
MNSLAQHSNAPSLQYFLDATFRGKRLVRSYRRGKETAPEMDATYAAPKYGRCPSAAGHLW